MKKLYVSLLTILAGLSASAQLTQSNNAPLASYTFQTYQCDSVGPGASGANAMWNYASITTHSSVLLTYQTSNVTNTSFPSATIAVGSSPGNTSYYNSSAGDLSYYGGNIAVGPVAGTITYTSPAIMAAYPMSLNTATNSAIGGSISVTSPPANGTFTGSSTSVADGTGTLVLPGSNATFTDAIRVVVSQTMNIVTSLATATVTQVNYNYYTTGTYSTGTRNPLFSVSTSTALLTFFGNTTTSTQTIVTRDKNASNTVTTTPTPTTTPNPTTTPTGLTENTTTIFNLNVFPNPSSSYVNFVTDNSAAQNVTVYDATGKIIEKQVFVDGKVKLDVASYNTGLYIYTVTSADNRRLKTGKVTVSH